MSASPKLTVMSDKKLLDKDGSENLHEEEETEESGVEGGDVPTESESDWLSESPSPTQTPRPCQGRPRQSLSRAWAWGREGLRGQLKLGFTGAIKKMVKGVSAGRGSGVGEYKLYRWRWFMLATLSLLNLSNGMVCNCST